MSETIQLKDIKKIAVFRTDRIGEVLLSTVCVDALKKRFPQSSITFVTSDYAKDIVSGRDDIDEIYIFSTISKSNSVLRLVKLILFLRRRKFDLAIILNPHKQLHFACFLAGIRYRLGFDRKWGFCLTHKTEDTKHEGKQHEIRYNLDLFKAVGIEADVTQPRMTISDKEKEYIDRLLSQSGLDNKKPIISIHAASSNAAKMWGKENFKALIKKIKQDMDCNVALLGDLGDKQLNLEIIEGINEPVLDLSGSFNIKQLAAFLARTKLYIGNDAGPIHIAAAVNTPVIALFGSASNPARWAPCGKDNVVLCNEDINAITVDEVLEAAKTSVGAASWRRTT